jgi:YD repeat-containing protein
MSEAQSIGRMAVRWIAALLFFASMLARPPVAAAQATTAPSTPKTVLDMLVVNAKVVRPLEAEFVNATRRGDLKAAEAVARRMIREAPHVPSGYYNLACLLANRGEKNEALKLLGQAIDAGFNNVRHIENDPDLRPLHGDKRFGDLLKRAREAKSPLELHTPTPYRLDPERALRTKQCIYVEPSNVGFDPRIGLPVALYKFEGQSDREICMIQGELGDLLRQWWKEGTAAGNWGDMYDNRDRNHSLMRIELFPQLTAIEYSAPAREARLDMLTASSIWHDGVVIGNASMAIVHGPFWRSMSRQMLQSPQLAALAHLQYSNNKIYVYPCHADYQAGRSGHNGYGDVYFANTPYLLTSVGSSGTDRPHLEALAAALAAFRPEVKTLLKEKGLLAPTLQMLFRYSNPKVQTPEDYLIGAVHRPVFDSKSFDPLTMVKMAHEIMPDTVPPLARLKMVEEDQPVIGRDYFALPGQTEVLFDTPGAIARVYRSFKRERRMIVSAGDSIDANNRPLTYHWRVLQGNPAAVKIKPLNDSGSLVEIVVPYAPRFPVEEGSLMHSNRVDIGAFVHNGAYYSAPAFVTVYMLDNEGRSYDEQGRIKAVSYNNHYVDPVVGLGKTWDRDDFHYDARGQLTGWTRTVGETKEEFDAQGRLGRKEVRYFAKPDGDKAPRLAYEVVK